MKLEALSPRARDLALRTLAWGDRLWDEPAGLPQAPRGAGFSGPGVPEGPLHLVPQGGWYAFGLLLRSGGNGGDRLRAVRVLETLLSLQYEEPGAAWDGTFARFAESPRPPRQGAVVWSDFDPNWRQFLGTTFLLILECFGDGLPEALVAALERSVRRAVQGEPPDRVAPSYANIALLHASLQVEAGARLGEPAWLRAGESLAAAVVERFDRHGAFDEYNSPTYYGIDWLGLSLWSRSRASPRLASEGRRLAAALWRDQARWYHAGLANACGPYTRSYGMDLRRYVSILSLFLWRELGAEHAPLPPLDEAAEHGHDFFLGALVAALGSPIPDEAREDFVRFRGPRSVRQRIVDEPLREATGHLEADWMAGAEHCDADLSWWDQYQGATLHWRQPNGDVGWLSLRAPGPVRAFADATGVHLDWDDGQPREGVLRLSTSQGQRPMGRDPAWRLPGLTLQIVGTVVEARGEGGARIRSATRDDRATLELRVLPER